MSARKKSGNTERYAGLPLSLLRHQNYIRMGAHAKVLLTDMRFQYNGFNNGNLEATWTTMQKRGWRSKDTLNVAIQELLYYGFIVRTRKGKRLGGVHYPSLYALTCYSIQGTGKGYPVSPIASDAWKETREPYTRPERKRKKPQPRQPYRPTPVAVAAQAR